MKRTYWQRAVAAVLCAAALACLPLSAYADKKDELQQKVDETESAYKAESEALEDAEEKTDAAQAQVTTLSKQSQAILNEIAAIADELEELSVQIADLQQQIADKETEIAAKQAEYDERKENCKERLGAMQEMNDGGALAMLTSAKDLYQLLSFSEVLQEMTDKDSEDLDALEQARQELETAKAALDEEEAALEETRAQQEERQAALQTKQGELATSLKAANQALSDAQAAEDAQAAITEETKKKWDAALAEQDAYIKGQLGSGNVPPLSCGMNFVKALPYYTRISTNFGDVDAWHSKAHGGTDFAAPAGTPIYATEDGYVAVARPSSSYGNYVVISHGTASDGATYATLYAHMTSYCVSAGQTVSRGQVIGYVGSTGNSTGNHLHLELWRNNVKINPLLYIPY